MCPRLGWAEGRCTGVSKEQREMGSNSDTIPEAFLRIPNHHIDVVR